MNDITAVVGVDIAKHVFQLHEVSKETGEIISVQLKRKTFLAHFANRSTCLIGMESCGGAQHWARKLIVLGRVVRLLPALQVKAFVCGNKNDLADARAIWMAVQQPGIRTAAIKTEAQQAVLAMHRIRQQLVKFRTAQINALRGLLTEYGEVMPQGRSSIARRLPDIFANLVLLTATAVVAAVGDAKTFKSGREFVSADAKVAHCAEVNLTHLGNNGGFARAVDVEPGAHSGDTSFGPSWAWCARDSAAVRLFAEYGEAVPSGPKGRSLRPACPAVDQTGGVQGLSA